MKLYIAALGILASTTSAVTPFRRLHFPRNNGTNYADGGLSYAAPKPALVTGSPGYGETPSSDDETVTATMTSVIHKTRTSYVHSSATPSVETSLKAAIPDNSKSNSNNKNKEDDSSSFSSSLSSSSSSSSSSSPLSTTTVTSKTLTTVTISRGAGAASNSAAPNSAAPEEDRCTPSTVTVTQPAVTKTVFVTATPEANERVPVFDKYRVSSFHKEPSVTTADADATTVHSVVTVMPFPTGHNGTHVPGAARPSTFARLYRRS